MKLATRTRTQPHSAVPVVNLLSPWTFEALATRRLRRRFTVAAAVLALLIGAGWGVQHVRVGQAEQVLTVEQAETTRLTAKTNELAPVRVYVATVEQQKGLVQQAMANDVHVSAVLDGIDGATPNTLRVEHLGVQETPPATDAAPEAVTPCPGPDPFNTRTVVGCVTLSGTAASRAAVGAFVVNLGADPLFVEPFISTTTTAEGDDVVFTGSVGLSGKSFSKRYADIEQLLAEVAR